MKTKLSYSHITSLTCTSVSLFWQWHIASKVIFTSKTIYSILDQASITILSYVYLLGAKMKNYEMLRFKYDFYVFCLHLYLAHLITYMLKQEVKHTPGIVIISFNIEFYIIYCESFFELMLIFSHKWLTCCSFWNAHITTLLHV